MKSKMGFDIGVYNVPGTAKKSDPAMAVSFDIPDGKLFLAMQCVDGTPSQYTETLTEAAQAFKQYFTARIYPDLHKALSNSIVYVNRLLFEQSGQKTPGISFVIALAAGDQLFYANAGNCRLWLLRNSKTDLLTTDHSQTAENGKVILTSYLGKEKDIKIGISKKPIALLPDDILVISDARCDAATNTAGTVPILQEKNKLAEHKILDLKEHWENSAFIIAEWIETGRDGEKMSYSSFNRYFVTMFLAIVVIAVCYYAAENFFRNPEITVPNEKIDKNINYTIHDDNYNDEVKNEPEEINSIRSLPSKANQEEVYRLKDTLITHNIISGETLYRIALRYHISVGELEQINGIKAANIRAGQKIKIPVAGYICVNENIQSGTLALKLDMPVNLILKANMFDNETVSLLGKCIIIPKK